MTTNYAETLDQILEVNAESILQMDLTDEKAEKAVKNLETLSSIRVQLYQAQQEAYEAEVKAQQEDAKAVLDRKNTIATWATNGFTAALMLFSAATPFVIMNAEKEGRFWSRAAMNAVEKGPKFGFVKAIFRK